MSYYIHRLRCWIALMSAMWTQAGADGKCCDCRHEKDIARKKWARQRELGRQLIEMRDRRVG